MLLLWLPRRWLRVGRAESRRSGSKPMRERLPHDLALRAGEELANHRNWLDFGRAVAGSIAVAGAAGGLGVVPGADEASRWTVFTLQALILGGAVVVQTLRLEGRVALFPPVMFVAGLMFGVLGWLPALLAFVAIWAAHIALPTPTVFLFVFGALVSVLGLLLGAEPRYAALAGGLAVVPMAVSLVSRRRLLPVAKKAKIVSR